MLFVPLGYNSNMKQNGKIWLSSPHMGGEEINFVQEAFETNWIAPLGPHVDGFEKDLCAFTGVQHAAALNSGTSAIHLALILLGVKRGDEVICQSFTFSASANPIVYQGATPIFIDSEKDSWNMDPYHLKMAILSRLALGKKPKAIIPVHLYGMPARMDKIMEIAREYEIPVIEDAAEALGSFFLGRACGSFGDCGILSFNGNKIITTSGGGALISNNQDWISRARFLATQARDNAPHYQHSNIGYNYRMSNVVAGIGRGQMQVLNNRINKKRDIFSFYQRTFTGSGIEFLSESENAFSNRWLTCALIDPAQTGGVDREEIRLALDAKNIESRPLWKPMHLQPVFKDAPYYGERVAEELFEKGLCLPSGTNLSDGDLDRVSKVIMRALRKEKAVIRTWSSSRQRNMKTVKIREREHIRPEKRAVNPKKYEAEKVEKPV